MANAKKCDGCGKFYDKRPDERSINGFFCYKH